MKIEFELLSPTMPNFIFVDMGKTGDKINQPQIAVSDLTEAQALEYAELMKREFILHWQKKSKNKNG